MNRPQYSIVSDETAVQPAFDRLPLDQAGRIHAYEQRLRVGPRILALIALSWLPVAVLDGLMGDGLLISTLWVNVPLLIVGPLLIISEAPVAMKVQLALEQLETSGIIRDRRRYDEILARGKRALVGRVGMIIEAVILIATVLAAISGLEELDPRNTLRGPSLTGGSLAAAAWFGWVSLSLLVFLRLRWAWRGVVWVQTLWSISRLPMNIYPTHTDQMGGLAVLGRTQASFGTVWLSISTLASVTIVHHVSLGGKTLQDYYAVIAAVVILEVLVTVLPMAFFIPSLKAAQIRGMYECELLSSSYSQGFDPKWFRVPSSQRKDILGNPDIPTLADLGSVYDRISAMGIFAGKLKSAKSIAVLGVLPFLPLALLVFPAKELVDAVIKLLF